MTRRNHRERAAYYGISAESWMECAFDTDHDDCAYDRARSAAHHAIAALESERVRDAPLNTILRNRALLEQRIASTPHCGVCGGKIKKKSRHGKFIAFECAKCGRWADYRENADEAKCVGKDPVVDVPVSSGEAGNEVVDVEGVA